VYKVFYTFFHRPSYGNVIIKDVSTYKIITSEPILLLLFEEGTMPEGKEGEEED
jgi:hypothetical protein